MKAPVFTVFGLLGSVHAIPAGTLSHVYVAVSCLVCICLVVSFLCLLLPFSNPSHGAVSLRLIVRRMHL
jgi:hypothetical protein